MATAAFKSSTKRSTFSAAAAAEDAGSSNRTLRRSRSLSRYSGRVPDGLRSPGGRSGSKNSDSDFPEISLDDLADEFFRSQNEEEDEEDGARPVNGRSRGRDAEVRYRADTSSSRRRGRSASRNRGSGEVVEGKGKGRSENSVEGKADLVRLRRQRSFSVARSSTGESEVMVKVEPTLLVNGHSRSSKVTQNTAESRRNCDIKSKLSENRRQDLLAKLAVKEQCGQEVSKIVHGLPTPKQSALKERPSRSTRKRNNKARMSKDLTEEAEKIFEDFLSNIEDTDFSSYDGERSETSSTLGGSMDSKFCTSTNTMAEIHGNLTFSPCTPMEKDGVVLPWLQWETKFPSPSKSKIQGTVASGCNLLDRSQEVSNEYSNNLTSSRGSWSPEVNAGYYAASRDIMGCNTEEVESRPSACVSKPNASFDMDDYLHLQQREDLLFEMVRQRQRIESGSLILCGRIF